MSFVRQERNSMNSKKTQARKKPKKRAPAWDGTTTDLSVHKLSKRELERRREMHKSNNLPTVKAERQMRSLIRKSKHSQGDLDKSNLLQEILYDEEQLRDAVGYSDRIMAVVHDLFGDDPARKAGRANVTLAPGVVSEKSVPKMLPDMTLNPSHLDMLSESVMDPHALNELDSEDEYSDDSSKENTPEGYEGSLDMERFRRYIQKESQAKEGRKGQETSKSRRQDVRKPGGKLQKHRKPLNEYNDLTVDDSDVEEEQPTRVQAINDTAKVKKKSLARTVGDSHVTHVYQGDADLARVIHSGKDRKKFHEEQKEGDDTDAVSILIRRVEEQSNLINALTLELMSTQERLSGVELQLQKMRMANSDGLSQSKVVRISPPKPPEELGSIHQQTGPCVKGGHPSHHHQPPPGIHQEYPAPPAIEGQHTPPTSEEWGRDTYGQAIGKTSGQGSTQPPVNSHGRRSQGMQICRENQQGLGSDNIGQEQFPDGGVNHHLGHLPLAHSRDQVLNAHVNNNNNFTPGVFIDRDSTGDNRQEVVSGYRQVTRVREGEVFKGGQAILLSPPRQRDRHTLFEAQGTNPGGHSSGRGGDSGSPPGGDHPVSGGPVRGYSHPGATEDDQLAGVHVIPGRRGAMDGHTHPVTPSQPVVVRGEGSDARLRLSANHPMRGGGGGHSSPAGLVQLTNHLPGQQQGRADDAAVSDGPQRRPGPQQTSDRGGNGRPICISESSLGSRAPLDNTGYHHFVDGGNPSKNGAAVRNAQLSRDAPRQVFVWSEDMGPPRDSSLLSSDSCSTYHSLPQMQDVGNPALVSSRLIYNEGEVSGSGVFEVPPNLEWDLSSPDAGFGVERAEAETMEAISDLTRKIAALSQEHAEAEGRLQAWRGQESASASMIGDKKAET